LSRILIAEFRSGEALLRAARASRERNLQVIDAFTPVPVEGLAELIGAASTRIRLIMFIGGMAVATLFYALEFYSAVINYPVNSGGRPLNSWLPFMLPPFATGIFGAALTGLIAFFVTTGLPQLHHPLFAVEGFEQVSQDRFVLLLERPEAAQDDEAARAFLVDIGAARVRESEP
jgi:Protein of unknown function (DUF3341)